MMPLPFLAQQIRPAVPAQGSGDVLPAIAGNDDPDAAMMADFAALLDGRGIHGLADVIARAEAGAATQPGEHDDSLVTECPVEGACPTGKFLPVALPDGISNIVPARPAAIAPGISGRGQGSRPSGAGTAQTVMPPAAPDTNRALTADGPAPTTAAEPRHQRGSGTIPVPGIAIPAAISSSFGLTAITTQATMRPVAHEPPATIALSDIAIVPEDNCVSPVARPPAETVIRQVAERAGESARLSDASQAMQASLPVPLQSHSASPSLAPSLPVGQATVPAPDFAPPDSRFTSAGRGDLGALVDRIVEARTAAQPFAVRASMTHAEFGQISLHFRADERHISATIASQDPTFAPAVQSAAAAVLSADAGQAGRDGQRGESAPGQHMMQHDRAFDGRASGGSGHERDRGERHAPRDWETPHNASSRPGEQRGPSARASNRHGDLFA